MTNKIPKAIPEINLKQLCNILGDTNSGLSGKQIKKILAELHIIADQPSDMTAKSETIFQSLKEDQSNINASNNALEFIKKATTLKPELTKQVNTELEYIGLQLQGDGKFHQIKSCKPIADVKIIIENFKKELKQRDAHQDLFKYCDETLTNNDYFHAVFEACKGLLDKIANMSKVQKDGNALLEEVFSKTPKLKINKFSSQSERDEQAGFANILKGIVSMFRNPKAHVPQTKWPINKEDALDILSIISYCYRRLDNATATV